MLPFMGSNRLQLGLFGANCSSGRTYADAPRALGGQLGEQPQAGADGGRDRDRVHGADRALEGLRRRRPTPTAPASNRSPGRVACWRPPVASTCSARSTCPCTIRSWRAKQMATADHIGQGRLGVNIVCGWNEDEFQMFGVTKKEHDDRYAQGEEWWSIVKRIWAGEAPLRLRRELLPAPRRGRLAAALRERGPADDERRQLRRGSPVRDPPLGHALRCGRNTRSQHRAHRRDQAAGARARP